MPTGTRLPTDRPSELAAFALLGPALYVGLAARGFRSPAAMGLAFGCALLPMAVSHWQDGRLEPGDPGDHDAEGSPPASPSPECEQHELTHR